MKKTVDLQFSKMHGLGNDFILLEETQCDPHTYPALARAVCHRNTGIGADGMIVFGATTVADVRMRIFNPDGSESSMCANGIRCLAKYLADSGGRQVAAITVATLAGVLQVQTSEEGGVTWVTVSMGKPLFAPAHIPLLSAVANATVEGHHLELGQARLALHSMRLGVPHTVHFVDDVDAVDIGKWGPGLERADAFPERANVNFAQIIDRNTIKVRTWERGAGPTLACASGACAVVVAARENGWCDDQVAVVLALGELRVAYRPGMGVTMTGPAHHVCSGTFLF